MDSHIRRPLRALLSIALDPWAWVIGIGWLVTLLVGLTAVLLWMRIVGASPGLSSAEPYGSDAGSVIARRASIGRRYSASTCATSIRRSWGE